MNREVNPCLKRRNFLSNIYRREANLCFRKPAETMEESTLCNNRLVFLEWGGGVVQLEVNLKNNSRSREGGRNLRGSSGGGRPKDDDGGRRGKKRGDGGREKKKGSKKFRPGTEVLICASEEATTFFFTGGAKAQTLAKAHLQPASSGVQRLYPSIRGKKKLPPAEFSRPLPFPAISSPASPGKSPGEEKKIEKNSGSCGSWAGTPHATPRDSGLSSLSAIR